MKPFCVEIICPLCPSRKEKVWFEQILDSYHCNGCDNFHGNAICLKCRDDMQKRHGGITPIEKQIKEMFEASQEK